MRQKPDHRPVELPLVDWMTYREVSMILMVSVKRLQNLVSEHKLERVRRRMRVKSEPGRPERRTMSRLSPDTVRTLARLTGNEFLVRKS